MELLNFKWKSPITDNIYTINGIIELSPNGYYFTKLTKINNIKKDSVVLKSWIKHEEILKHIKKC